MSWFRIVRRVGRYSLVAFLTLLLLVSAFLWYITTDSFQQMVRRRLIASLEHATGGRVEIGSFHVVPLRFEVEVRDLTIHGREAPAERPLAHVDSMSAVVDLTAVLGIRMGFDRLTLVHPVVHFIYYPDGSTNQPSPPSSGAAFDKLFSISIHRLEIQQGELFFDEQRVPFEFVSNDVEAKLDYAFLRRRYSGELSVGRAETQLAGYRPFSWAAKTEFSIGHDEVQIRSLSVRSEGSTLQGGATISGFRNPSLQGNYDLLLDVQQTAAILREPHRAGGKLRVRGVASWSKSAYGAGGDFDLIEGAWNDRNLRATGLTAAGKFALDPTRFAMTQVQGRALRGSFSSELEVINWNGPDQQTRSKKQAGQRGAAVLKARDISLADLLASLGPRFDALKSLHLSGSLSTSSELHWKDSIQNSEISSSLSVARPARVSAGQVPLTATTQFKYQFQPARLEITDLNASTPASHLRAVGTLSNESALRLSANSDNVNEWTPLLRAAFPQGLPISIRGPAIFNGTVAGRFKSPILKGNLQLHEFDTAVSRQGNPPRTVQWNFFTSELQLSADDLVLHNGVFRRGETTIRVDGSVGLKDWNSEPRSPIRLSIQADNVPASDLETLAGQAADATGNLSGHLELAGTVSEPEGQGSIKWSSGSIRGYPFDHLVALVSLARTRVTFRSLDIIHGRSHVSGTGWYDVSSHGFDASINGRNFDISDVAAAERSRVKISGTLDFSAIAKGSIARPEVNAQFHLRDVAFNGEAAGGYLIDAVTKGDDLHLTGHSEFVQSELLIDGNVRLRELWPARIDFHFNHLDVDSFLASYLHGHITGHSVVAGDLVLQGPLRDPRRLTLTGNLSDLYAEVEKIKIRNDGPLRFTVDQQTLHVDSMRLIGENTDFSLKGTMQFTGDQQLNFTGDGKLGLQLVQTYNPDLTGSGQISGHAAITGNVSSPVVRGTLQVQNGSLADINLPSALTDLNGSLIFSQNQVTIEKLTGRTGGGTVSFSGSAQLNGAQINFDLRADADSVRLRYPPGVSSTATASLRWNGSSSGSLLSGDVTINKLGVTPGFDFGAYLTRSIQSASLPQTDPVLNNIRLDLHVVTAPDLQMQTSVLRLRGDADLRVRGNAAKPVLLGRADVFEGEAFFNGTKYRLERGGITFGTPAASNAAASVPIVDFEATTHVRDYDITLSVTGPADHPKMNYRSEPPLPTNDIIGLLAFGQTTEESTALQQSNQSAFSQQASSAMLAAALNATLNNRTQRLFGNSRIKIDPQGLATETSPTQAGPAVTIEQQVKDNLTITYTTDVAQTSQQIIRAEYYVSRNVSVVAIRDQNGIVSFDVKIRRRKR